MVVPRLMKSFYFVLRFPPARPRTHGAGKVEYIPYHICGSRTVLPRISMISGIVRIGCRRSIPRK